MKCLVTGGAGFIGSHLVEKLLQRGDSVCAVDNLDPFYDPAQKRSNLEQIQARGGEFTFQLLDISQGPDLEQLCQEQKFDLLFHLAARPGVRPSLQDPALYQRINVEGTVRVLEAARQSGVPKVILASSSSVYGLNSVVPFSEEDPVRHPISPYAASKLACEALGHVYHHLYGMEVVMLRFFSVYGPRQRPDLAIRKFAEQIWLDLPIPVFGDGTSARDYTYIDDIVEGVLAAADRRLGFEIINLGDAQPILLSRLISLLEETLGKKARLERLPAQPGDVPVTFANIDKARRLLGYEPRTSIEKGIPRFVEWLQGMRAGEVSRLSRPLQAGLLRKTG